MSTSLTIRQGQILYRRYVTILEKQILGWYVPDTPNGVS